MYYNFLQVLQYLQRAEYFYWSLSCFYFESLFAVEVASVRLDFALTPRRFAC